MRTLIDIPEEDLAEIKRITQTQGISRAEYVRRAIRAELQRRSATDRSRFFGVFAADPEDGVAFQDRMRSEWDGR